MHCDDWCACKKIAIDNIQQNPEFPRGLKVPVQNQIPAKLPPVDVNIKLRSDCKAHIMELVPDLFQGVGTMKDTIVKLDVYPSITHHSLHPAT